MLNEKDKMARLVTEERRVLTGSLHAMLDIQALFQQHRSPPLRRASDDTEVGRVSKREHQETEVARRASIIDERLWQQRDREVGVGASSRLSTTDGAVRVGVSTTDGEARVDASTTDGAEMVDVGTTDGDPSFDLVGSEKPNPPACG
uniref:Integrase core domain containing protein n=1 Tax=Solanum tuberosum TaxID=4113 RepID=M1DNM1_SOLTU